MSRADAIPMEVLSRALGDAIGGRRVRTAVFTTFSFDPSFFELQVLPALFERSFSQVEKVRRIQLEDALRELDGVAAYYDRSALSQDAQPAQLDFRRIDVRRATGCFHPKIALLLVDEPQQEEGGGSDYQGTALPYQSLIVLVSSANLTRAGWWENVECFHIEEIQEADLDDTRCAFRPDLMNLLSRIRSCASPGEDHAALDRIYTFLRDRTPRARIRTNHRGQVWRTRLFCGQNQLGFSDWLSELRLYSGWNLEVISPYFDEEGAGPLEKLVESLDPREIRVFLPREADGRACVTKETHDVISKIPRCSWAELPAGVTLRGKGEGAEKLAPRRVHAKVYRLWAKGEGDVLLVGSVNLTSAGHSHGGAGNLEAAFLVDQSETVAPRWWLERSETSPKRFVEDNPDEEDGTEPALLDVSIRFDWSSKRLSWRLEQAKPESFEVAEMTGRTLFHAEASRVNEWVDAPAYAAEHIADVLRSTSFVLVRYEKGAWRVLVREENMAHRPSLLLQLTPEEILEYWALLTPEQRVAYLEERAGIDEAVEGLALRPTDRLRSRNTIFDRFAGIFHAFGCLRRHIEEALEEERPHDAEARLLGAKYDSLPNLLQKTFDRTAEDPVTCYVTFLAARDLYDNLRRSEREFFKERRGRTKFLDDLLARIPEIRASLPLSGAKDTDEFLSWFEESFRSSAAVPR